MWKFIKTLFQLLFIPSEGWAAISSSTSPFEATVLRGYFPLVAVAAISEFVPMAYTHDLTFLLALGNAIAVGGGMYAALYAARLAVDASLSRFVNPKLNRFKSANLVVYLLGLDCLYLIFSNLLPGTLTFLLFLPLLSVAVIFKGAQYIEVDEEHIMNYIILAFTGVVVIPAVICWLLMLII